MSVSMDIFKNFDRWCWTVLQKDWLRWYPHNKAHLFILVSREHDCEFFWRVYMEQTIGPEFPAWWSSLSFLLNTGDHKKSSLTQIQVPSCSSERKAWATLVIMPGMWVCAFSWCDRKPDPARQTKWRSIGNGMWWIPGSAGLHRLQHVMRKTSPRNRN